MKPIINAFLMAVCITVFFSCKKEIVSSNVVETTYDNPDGYSGSACPATTVKFIAGQNIDAGTVTVTNDFDFIYVTYNTANGYVLQETHLYVGDCSSIPVNKQGNPVPGQFPFKTTHTNITSFTYKVPVSTIALGSCGCIASHAAVVKLNSSGNVIDTQTAWGQGTSINPSAGNWGMKFSYCSCAGVD